MSQVPVTGKKRSITRTDRVGRLIEAASPKTPATKFSYDSKGNIREMAIGGKPVSNIAHNTKNQLMSWGEETFEYDKAGRLIGIRTEKGKTVIAYDVAGRPVGISMPGDDEVSIGYDPLGRRNMKRTGQSTRLYVYDGNDLTWEMDGQRKVVATFTHGPGLDEPLAMKIDGKSYFLHADGMGSIRVVTDSDGKPVNRIAYTPFGTTVAGDTDIGGPYRYVGRIFDRETGLYYYRNRYYHPGIARFITPDPIGYLSGDHNFYSYARNNPVNFTDPFGAEPKKGGSWLEQANRFTEGLWERYGGREAHDILRGIPGRAAETVVAADEAFRRNVIDKLPKPEPGLQGNEFIGVSGQGLYTSKTHEVEFDAGGGRIIHTEKTAVHISPGAKVSAFLGGRRRSQAGGPPQPKVRASNVEVDMDGNLSIDTPLGEVSVDREGNIQEAKVGLGAGYGLPVDISVQTQSRTTVIDLPGAKQVRSVWDTLRKAREAQERQKADSPTYLPPAQPGKVLCGEP